MTCPRLSETHDQELLLLAHGELPLWPRLRLQSHLRRCVDCRERLSQLTQTSQWLASGIRGSGLPAWSLPQAASTARSAALAGTSRVLLALTLALLVAVLCVAAWRTLSPSPHPSAPASGLCRPDLPNSRCR